MTHHDLQRLMADAVRSFEAGALSQAASLCRQVLRVDAGHVDALGLLGVAEGRVGNMDAAIRHLRQAVALVPDNPGLHVNLGMALLQTDAVEEGTAHYAKAAQLAPDNGTILYDYACALERQGRLDESESVFRRAIKLIPDSPGPYNNLGNVLLVKGEPAQAFACFEKALQRKPDLQEAYVNAGLALFNQGRFPRALEYYDRALALNPDDSKAHVNRAIWYFLQGDLSTAWPEYEWRWRNEDKIKRNFPFPAWDGASLADKTLLFYAEQGIGDELMFASCIPELLERARHVVIECAPRLAPLFVRSFPGSTVQGGYQIDPVDWIESVGKIDIQVACGTAAGYLRPDTGSFPDTAGYLIADKQTRQAWRERFDALGRGLKVGVSWRGGRRRAERRARSIPLDLWEPVLAVPGVHFINLQYGKCEPELEHVRRNLGYRVWDWPESDPMKNLDGFAAQIAELDLVISIDNSTVHMAGGLEVPVWTLLPYVPEWRWMLKRSDTPWYPTMRLFRQSRLGDWKTVIREVADRLRGIATQQDFSNGG